jgi:hypothetical protein
MRTEKKEPNTNAKQETTIGRRDALKLATAATATTTGAGLAAPAVTQTTSPPETNPYGSPPRGRISIPPFYKPTPSINNRNNFFPQTEELGADEMRISSWAATRGPPLQPGWHMHNGECGNVGRFLRLRVGRLRNIVGMQVPRPAPRYGGYFSDVKRLSEAERAKIEFSLRAQGENAGEAPASQPQARVWCRRHSAAGAP